MWQILPLNVLIAYFAVASILTFVVAWKVSGAPHFWRRAANRFAGLPRIISISITATTILTLIVGYWMWKPIASLEFFAKHYYPDISGYWVGEIQSNWINPRTGRRVEAIPLKVEIEQNFFHVNMKLVSENRYTVSNTVTVWPESNAQIDNHRLWYLFTAEIREPEQDDSNQHEGLRCWIY
jgi:hypothetical protein